MTEDKKIENEKMLSKDELKNVNGGIDKRASYTKCPQCHKSRYDVYCKRCTNCGYKG